MKLQSLQLRIPAASKLSFDVVAISWRCSFQVLVVGATLRTVMSRKKTLAKAWLVCRRRNSDEQGLESFHLGKCRTSMKLRRSFDAHMDMQGVVAPRKRTSSICCACNFSSTETTKPAFPLVKEHVCSYCGTLLSWAALDDWRSRRSLSRWIVARSARRPVDRPPRNDEHLRCLWCLRVQTSSVHVWDHILQPATVLYLLVSNRAWPIDRFRGAQSWVMKTGVITGWKNIGDLLDNSQLVDSQLWTGLLLHCGHHWAVLVQLRSTAPLWGPWGA